MKKLNITLGIIIIIILVALVALLALTTTACKKAESMCENEWNTYAENSSVFLPYTDEFGNPTSAKPLSICKEDK